jgi:Zn-dependent protease with chaperone function
VLFWALSIKQLSGIMGLFFFFFINVYFDGTYGWLVLILPLYQPLTVKSLLQSYAKAIFIQLRNNAIHFSKIFPVFIPSVLLLECIIVFASLLDWMSTKLKTREVVDSTTRLNLSWVKFLTVFIRNILSPPPPKVWS